jgi:magnesium-transporting ATPase (P-type)
MGKINLQRVILGGLVAGVVLNVFDFVLYGVVFKDDYNAALQALGKPAMTNNMVLWFVALDFLFGIFLVWLYAAIRPRFGAGPGTAVKAGLAMWVLFGLLHALSEAPMGLFPQNLWVIGTLAALVVYPLAAVAGAKLYTEM